jgi:shikimate kinase
MNLPARKPLRLALIGMSGVGKTFWAKQLAEHGHPIACCDDEIERTLGSRLAKGGFQGIHGMAAWMGWPNSPTYVQRESEYLAAEIAVLDKILTHIEKHPEQSLILDTTGSIIYTGTNLLLRLRRQMTVVHLAVSEAEQELLIRRYLSDPKPVLWRGAFQPKAMENPRQTVARCYPMLIAARRQSYQALAHCTVQIAELKGIDGSEIVGATRFLENIQDRTQ